MLLPIGEYNKFGGKIMALSRTYILAAFAWLVAAMVFGIYIGIIGLTVQSNAHAHAGLLGFVASALFGLFHRNWPKMGTSKLALAQFVIYQVGTVLLVVGKYQVDATGDSVIVAPGSIIVIAGTLLMAWLFATRSAD